MTSTQRVFTGSPWEKNVAYCRAIRVGDLVAVSGTTASDENGQVQSPGDLYGQTKYIFAKIESALAEFHATLADVYRTRMYVTDINRWEEAGRAHRETFHANPPAATMVEVSALIDPHHLIEIEVDACCPRPASIDASKLPES